MSEQWKPIIGFIGLYEVSSLGYVKSLKTGTLIKRTQSESGYLSVTLHKNGKAYWKDIHRLVCTAFHGLPPFEGAMALHKDDIKIRCVPDNLYWGTHQDNMDDMKRNRSFT